MSDNVRQKGDDSINWSGM